MKFIHCSDIHLDSRMERNLTASQARERNAEVCATFGRLVDYAVREQVTAVLIAGDMFDTERASAQTANFVLSRMWIFCICGAITMNPSLKECSCPIISKHFPVNGLITDMEMW